MSVETKRERKACKWLNTSFNYSQFASRINREAKSYAKRFSRIQPEEETLGFLKLTNLS